MGKNLQQKYRLTKDKCRFSSQSNTESSSASLCKWKWPLVQPSSDKSMQGEKYGFTFAWGALRRHCGAGVKGGDGGDGVIRWSLDAPLLWRVHWRFLYHLGRVGVWRRKMKEKGYCKVKYPGTLVLLQRWYRTERGEFSLPHWFYYCRRTKKMGSLKLNSKHKKA